MRYVDTALEGQDQGLWAWLEPRLADAELFALRTGFLSLPAVQVLAAPLASLLDRGGRVEMVLGGDELQADPAALRELLVLTEHSERAAVRVVTDPGVFHNAKTYYLDFPGHHAEAWVGSANLTRGGLQSNHEAGMALAGEQQPDVVAEVLAGIECYRTDPSAVPLDAQVVRQLEARRAARSAARSQPAMGHTRALEDLLQPAMETLDAAASRKGPVSGVPTGFRDLDLVLGGLQPGTLTVVASRPSVGRSTVLLNFVRSSALHHNLPTALFSAELPTTEITQRTLSAEARIRLSAMRQGSMSDEEWARLATRISQVSEAPLLINTNSAPHLEALVTEITTLCSEHPVALVALDPLGAIAVPAEAGASRERELSLAMRRLKTLARELEIPIVVTAELNRGPEYRADKRPQLADLRESDTIAQVADTVILLHRPDAYDPDDPRMGEADLIVAKHRAGPTSTLLVAHQLHYCRFMDLALD